MYKWRFFELKNNAYHTLFHGIDGSRRLPINQWLKADQRVVSEGRDARRYRSGFHVFTSLEVAKKFINKFRSPRTIVAVQVEVAGNVRTKPTNKDVLLVNWMRIPQFGKHLVLKG